MIDPRVLDLIMKIELAFLLVSVLVFFLHGLWLYVGTKRKTRLLREAREALIRVLANQEVEKADRDLLRSLPRSVKTKSFLEMSRNLTGAAKSKLKDAARDAGLVDIARDYCSSSDWRYRLRGVRLMANLEEPDELMRVLLHDGNAVVRGQAAEWAASNPVPGVITDLLTLLSDPDASSRFAVQDSLLRMGRAIVPALCEYLEAQTGPALVEGLELAEAVAEGAFLDAALKHSHAKDAATRAAAASLLAGVGGEKSCARLNEMLADEQEAVRGNASRGLGRLKDWRACTKLADLLEDPHWKVRRESALALRRIGGPGILLLRQASQSKVTSRSDIAQLILDTPLQSL